jgi:hypothetical protein
VKVAERILTFPKAAYVFLALLLRLALAPFLSHPFDERIFMAVGASVAKGITPYGQYVLQYIFAATPHRLLYGTVPGIGYPPPWGLMCGDLYLLSSALAPNNLYAYVLALKLPVIIGELALAGLVYFILRQEVSERTATKAFLLFLFCPFIIAVGTVWGMFDAVAMFFALFSAWSLQENWKVSAVFLSIASVLKVYPLLLVPLYSLLLLKRQRKLRATVGFLSIVAVLAALFTLVPMLVYNWPLSNMYNALTYQLGTANSPYNTQVGGQAGPQFPYGAASPFNVFTLLSETVSKSFQPPSVLVYLWIPACLAVYVLLVRAKTSRKSDFGIATTMKWSLLLMLTFFTTRVWVSEQNLVFLFTFFAFTIFLSDSAWANLHILWVMLLCFVVVHVPAVSFLWMPYPWTLDSANSFADGPLGWTRLLMMTILTFCWLVLSWNYATKKLRWKL